MNQESKTLWDDIPNDEKELDTEDREFVTWDEPFEFYHENDEPHVGLNKFGKPTYYFNGKIKEDFMVMSVTSVRLMIKIKKLKPLAGKIVRYERVGSGYETDYEVKEVKEV